MTDSTSHTVPSLFVGIDVAKHKLDLARSDSKTLLTLDNAPGGIGQIVQVLLRIQPTIVVVEATGGLERPLLDAMVDAGLPVALVNPGHVRHLAKGLGILAKTDKASVLERLKGEIGKRLASNPYGKQAVREQK